MAANTDNFRFESVWLNSGVRQRVAKFFGPSKRRLRKTNSALNRRIFELETALENERNRFQYISDNDLAKRRIIELTRLMTPCRAAGVEKVRLGNKHDGGYVYLDDFNDVDAALSFGIGNDVSWDLDVANKDIPVYQYDHTVPGPPLSHPHFQFHPKRLGTVEDEGETIEEIVLKKNLTRPASLIMKIDIEGAEWDVIDNTSEQTLSLFSQIAGEFHWFDEVLDDKFFACALRIFEKLSKNFCLVHVHANNYSSQMIIDEMLFPRVLELTFANRSRYALAPSDERFPSKLDTPNNPLMPDFRLGRFIYS